MSTIRTENLALRRAMSAARLLDRDVAEAIRVDPKTVQRWLAGRRPQPQHRWALADLVGVHESELWPGAGLAPALDPEVVTVYPHRSSVPREVWHDLFAGAGEEVEILVYSGLFLAEDVDLMQVVAGKAAAGVAVRVLLGDPEAAAVTRRGSDEGIDEAMAAKARNALVLHRSLTVSRGAVLRLHATVLYTSIYRADDEMVVNVHVYGLGAAQAPVLHLRRQEGGRLFATYVEAFARVWANAQPVS
jgi:transcriptional regulator with XRE-family HTH domain